MCCESRYRITVSAFGGQPSPDVHVRVANRDGPQAVIVLAKCYHILAKMNGSHLSGASTAEQQVHKVRVSTNGPDASPNATKSSKWPDVKPSGPPADPAGNERTAQSTSAG